MENKRTRTFSWENPLDGASKARNMSGLEYLEAMRDGHIAPPPIMHTLDFNGFRVEKGSVSFTMNPEEFQYNPIGTVHGGVISTILDSAMGCTVQSVLPKGSGYTTLELKVNFLKAVTTKSGKMTAIGKLIHAGKSTALVEASLTDENGNVYAHSVSTCLIMQF
ncbi:uncharacterized domain 1-containing protein [Flexibacter flexilis DSM 6793]|uniref:Uncharacterized domain 1-containing protein n=1 Tax=Flexibacter flexilis DSM 6793 TaxID=927664 RepID=A0A1I1F402_9BACT|nr:PaaI family thioesterase [Flexibacter flexilis]SFB93672.1 uncharacterized domain 1-containing protein [Flexibacter flexilis DSM 6793]